MPNAPTSLFSGTRVSAPAPMPVLILEDERFDRHRLARMCSTLDFPCQISNAMNLQDFSTALENEAFGLILLDYSLPDGTGLEALEMVRLCAQNLNAPTLMISGMTHSNIADQARAAGCRDYLSKDALTSSAFGVAVKNALRQVSDRVPTDKQTFAWSELSDLLGQMSARNAKDIKPMVSRIMRQLRGLRSHSEGHDLDGLQAVEQNCMTLWAFLVEMERQDSDGLLQDILGGQKDPFPVPVAATKPRRPPSPFSSFKH